MRKSFLFWFLGAVLFLSSLTPSLAVEGLLDGGGRNLGAGGMIDLSIGVRHTGSTVNVDIYLGLVAPNSALAFFSLGPGGLNLSFVGGDPTTWPSLLSNLTLGSGIDTGLLPIFKAPLSGNEPPGVYQWALFFTEAGTLNLMDLKLYPFLLVPFAVQDFIGTWAGVWNNTTFSSSGALDVVISEGDNPGELNITVDLGGNVLGGVNPPPFTIMALVDAVEGLSLQGNAGVLGASNVSIAPDGSVEGVFQTNSVPGISSVEVSGNVSNGVLSGDYSVNFVAGAPAMGTLSATLQ